MFAFAAHTANHAPDIAVLIVPALVYGPAAVFTFLHMRSRRRNDDA